MFEDSFGPALPYTYYQIASEWGAWSECVGCYFDISKKEFDALSVDAKKRMLVEVLGPEF